MSTLSSRLSLKLTILIVGMTVARMAVAGNEVGAQAAKARIAIDSRGIQQSPIKLGTSGGVGTDLANGYCCGGTLGSLVTDGQTQYILSNYHVLAGDQTPGGNGTVSAFGDPIIQPGLIDVGCNASRAQVVAKLSAYTDPFQGANVDAAIAEVVPNMVDGSGGILGIGTISAATVAASPRQSVKKSGRTTGLTSSQVKGINATVSVSYDTECAGTSRGVKTYTGQILVSNNGSKFLAAGDSGSLMVENKATFPGAVGLLYAGSSTIAVANPIAEVLSALQVTMVGAAGAAGAPPADAAVDKAVKTQTRHARELERVPRGVGHAVGLTAAGRLGVLVLVESDAPAAKRSLPDELDGVPVEVLEVGRIVAF